MPPLRYLTLYDDVEIPEAPTLFDRWKDNASPARFQEMEIDRHMDLNYDLFVDLTPFIGHDWKTPANTGYDLKALQDLAQKMCEVPDGVQVQRQVFLEEERQRQGDRSGSLRVDHTVP